MQDKVRADLSKMIYCCIENLVNTAVACVAGGIVGSFPPQNRLLCRLIQQHLLLSAASS